jgi:ACS family tartrate transporter-like MFS transporter
VSASPAPAPSTIEATTIRKLRTHIIPFVFVLFVINFVDRINIGFAALTMNNELAITSQQFGLLSGIFFWGYFIFEIPSNLLLHKLGARIWIARILVSWGIVAILTGFVRSATHQYLLRFLLGAAEAGFVPGILLYLTYWFPQRQLAHSISLFNSAGPVASIVGAPISGVGRLERVPDGRNHPRAASGFRQEPSGKSRVGFHCRRCRGFLPGYERQRCFV